MKEKGTANAGSYLGNGVIAFICGLVLFGISASQRDSAGALVFAMLALAAMTSAVYYLAISAIAKGIIIANRTQEKGSEN